jgi:chemotaxis protein MotB
MATLADMSILLMTFFVLLLSFASTDVKKFQLMIGSVRGALGTPPFRPDDAIGRLADGPSGAELAPVLPDPAGADAPMLEALEDAVRRLELERMVEVVETKRGVVVRVKGALLFDSGAAALRPQAFVLLDEIAQLTQASSHHLAVEGHSDDLAIHGGRFPSNWELSAARAIAVVRYLVEVGGVDPRMLSAVGCSDTRPIVPNDSAENRARNRRVDFVYLRDPPDSPADTRDEIH